MRACATGLPPSRSRPVTGTVSFDDGVQPRTVSCVVPSAIRAAPAAAMPAAETCTARAACDGFAVCDGPGSRGTAATACSSATIRRPLTRSGDPPSENTISFAAVPPFDDVGVPPTVIARYYLPPAEKMVDPAAI